ncbi:MAG: D-2-hydroxyacid dehydrogenase [Planctomycetaceae bacterium]|jgi:D-3-phosphoglycerate dehydrogenase|nr:D-2-hydroxyacid dehydrogenase [Planctomycetaceae bacterium]
MNLLLCYPVNERHVERVRQAWEGIRLIFADQNNREESERKLFDADYFCGHVKQMVDWKSIVRQGRLQWIQSSAAGMDHCLVPAVIESNILVTSASGLLADQVAEHTMALTLGWLRNLPAFLDAQKKKEFIRRPTRDLTRATVGIVGFGGNGRRLAQTLAPFHTRILATDMFPEDKPPYVAELWAADRLDDLLAESDVVLLNLPLNDSTRKLFNAETIAKMKRGSLLVNMARGPIVDTDALTNALNAAAAGNADATIAGAVLDVADPEPLPADHPLWNCPNVIITPHVGGQFRWRNDDVTDLLCENIRRFRAGEPLINLLTDKKLGFPIRSKETPLWIDVKDALRR